MRILRHVATFSVASILVLERTALAAPIDVPEIDANMAGTAVALLVGGFLLLCDVVRGRSR